MAEQGKSGLFREKSLEAIESPEALNDYLRVTSPGVWLVLASVIVLLIGAILWGIYGRIDTTVKLAVRSSGGQAVAYVPYGIMQDVMKQGVVTINDKPYALTRGTDAGVVVVSETTNIFMRVAGGLKLGDMIVEVPVEATDLPDDVYTGTVVTESLQPIELLLQ